MIKNIISDYFQKILLSYLDEKRKLTLIKYNKKFQSLMNRSLIIYNFFSGKYITNRENVKVKIYNGNNDKLIYEGGYLNGKKNEIGKEYEYKKIGDYNKLIF